MTVPPRLDVSRTDVDAAILRRQHRPGRDVVAFVLFAAQVARLLRSLAPDVVHANVPRSHMTLFLARRFGFAGACVIQLREIFARGSVAGALYSVWNVLAAQE
jgi:hypothetical protein